MFFIDYSYSQMEVSQPQSFEFKSTSNMLTNQTTYSVPFAARDINGTTYDSYHKGARRALVDDDDDRPSYDPNEPVSVPIGDCMVPLIMFSLLYIFILYKLIQ